MSIKERIEQEFIENFNLNILLKFVEDRLYKYGDIEIGLVNDGCNKSLKESRFQTEGYVNCNKKWPTFQRGYETGYWTSDCQIPHQLVPYVKKQLAEQGLNTNCKGVCGYDTYDVLVVTL